MTDGNGARLDYRNGAFLAAMPRPVRRLPGADVVRIVECRMADPISHGEEDFHILLTADAMLLVGPFVAGALGALEAFRRDFAAIPSERRLVRTIPWRFREAGFLGLRPFPVAGLVLAPRPDLAAFEFLTEGPTDG